MLSGKGVGFVGEYMGPAKRSGVTQSRKLHVS